MAPAEFDRRAVLAFVAITFGLTWSGEAGAFALVPALRGGAGLVLFLSPVMWIPALASWLTCRLVTGEPWAARVGLVVRGHVRRVVTLAGVALGLVVLAVVVGTAVAAVTGVARLDAGLSGLTQQTATVAGAPPAWALVLLAMVSGVIAPVTLNGLLALGEELG